MLFVLNLTVTDGDINGFILYVNIIGINNDVFFPRYANSIKFWYTVISLANLDLEILVYVSTMVWMIIITEMTVKWINRSHNKPQHCIELNNTPPNIAHSYQELRELLVGQD